MHIFSRIKNNLKYLLVIVVSVGFFLGGISNAGDLLRRVTETAWNKGTMITISQQRDIAGRWILHGATQVDLSDVTDEKILGALEGGDETEILEALGIEQEPPLIVKLIRYFLEFAIAISVTMILYNGFTYIIQTGRGKEAKNLVSNIIYIVVGILIALFSVIIITILQSAGETINNTIALNQNNFNSISCNIV